MKILILAPILLITSCTTINVTAQGDVVIDAHKQVITDVSEGAL